MGHEAVSHEASGVTGEVPVRIAILAAIGIPLELADPARRRLEFALGRFGGRIRSVTVRLGDVNGPRGGVDKTCLVTIRFDASKRLVVIEDADADAAVAIDRAADRASRAGCARAAYGGGPSICPSVVEQASDRVESIDLHFIA